MKKTKNLLVVLTMWQIVAAQENCREVKLSAGLESLLGDIPISNCAPDLPLLPDLASSQNEFLDGLPESPGFPGFDFVPGLPSLPYGDCDCQSSLPSLPELPNLADFYDYPGFGESLPYWKKNKGCGRLAKPDCLPAKMGKRKQKQCRLKKKENYGVGLKIVPLIKQFRLKKKEKSNCFDGVEESLPYEIPNLISMAIRESILDDC